MKQTKIVPQDITARFLADHPYQLTDGRRFRSLRVAAQSAVEDKLLPVLNVSSGLFFDAYDCKRELDRYTTKGDRK